MPYARSPKISIREHSRFKMEFQLSNTDVSMANALRRTMIAEVPTMAINLVTVLENTSALADEYIVHRLGLIPLHSEQVEKFNDPYNCDCDDYCENCSVLFSLNVTAGPTEQVRKVTSRDLIIDTRPEFSHCHSVRPVHDSGDVETKPAELAHRSGEEGTDGIIIARLACGQKIDMRAIARRGIAKDHAKHSPMCTVSYRIMPPAVELMLDQLNESLPHASRKELADSAVGVIYLDDVSGDLKYTKPFLLGRIGLTPDTTRKAGELMGGKTKAVVRHNDPEYYLFTAETTGAMTPNQALQMALKILVNKVDTVMSHVR